MLALKAMSDKDSQRLSALTMAEGAAQAPPQTEVDFSDFDINDLPEDLI